MGQGLDIGLDKFKYVGFDMWCQLDPFVGVKMSKGSNQIGVSLMLGKPRQWAYRVRGLLGDFQSME